MAHFARIETGTVQEVVVVNNDVIATPAGNDSETKGKKFLQGLLGADTEWVQTSYSSAFRGKYAGIGDIWDGTNFISPEPPAAEPVP
jgi:hypothetical protein